tara:strand:- start:769 stop:1215 length:447 start_codon:yes stop_codon:yes gene_type:complete
MIVSYDIDGVLAKQPPPSIKKWGRMNGVERRKRKEFLNYWYLNADKLIEPKEKTFYAISARRNEKEIIKITNFWLKKNYPERVVNFYLLSNSRSLENVIEFKTNVIKHLQVNRHYEDNKKVLKGLKKSLPNVELYFWELGMTEPILYT